MDAQQGKGGSLAALRGRAAALLGRAAALLGLHLPTRLEKVTLLLLPHRRPGLPGQALTQSCMGFLRGMSGLRSFRSEGSQQAWMLSG